MNKLDIGRRRVGAGEPTFFIADIAANHDGDLNKAIDLIYAAAESGADAAKFQHFLAPDIVSRYGFESLGGQMSHQRKWQKSVYQVYEDASLHRDWTPVLKDACEKAGIEFFSSPYDFAAVDMLEEYVPAYKIGSGDITWSDMLIYIAEKGKPVLLATGASDIGDVQRAVGVVLSRNSKLLLMQCNTNYTANHDNFKYLQLNVLKTYSVMFPNVVLGLSDHTLGYASVLGAVALGASAIEKHFTLVKSADGPDHAFSVEPHEWREMVNRTRELDAALGDGNKQVQVNEEETVVVQRRCLRTCRDLKSGEIIGADDIVVLRPAPVDSVPPDDISLVVGRRLKKNLECGDYVRLMDIE